MRAIRIAETGGPEVLKPVEIAMPEPGAGEVLVRAHAIGVGKPDVLFRTGVYRWMPPLPAIPGAEMTGRIEAVGAGAEAFVKVFQGSSAAFQDDRDGDVAGRPGVSVQLLSILRINAT